MYLDNVYFSIMTLSITLIPALATDADELASLRATAMRESLEHLGRFDPQRAKNRFLTNFSPEYTHHIETKQKRDGVVVVRPIENGLLLDHLYILPEHQGQGIGAVVLQRVTEDADAKGLPLHVTALRERPSNRFYTRFGF